MTFKEKLEKEHPEELNPHVYGGCNGCPSGYGYEKNTDCSGKPFSDEKCTKCWNREIPDTPATMTAEEVWELVKKIYDFPCDKHEAIFGEQHSFYEVISELTIHEVKAKLEEWENRQIQVGDVCVFGKNSKMVVTKVSHSHCFGVYIEHPDKASIGEGGLFQTDKLHKTGKHIDIQSVLDQIGGEEND